MIFIQNCHFGLSLFRSMSKQMRSVTFTNDEDLRNWLTHFFNIQLEDFWRDKLVDKWEQVINKMMENILLINLLLYLLFFSINLISRNFLHNPKFYQMWNNLDLRYSIVKNEEKNGQERRSKIDSNNINKIYRSYKNKVRRKLRCWFYYYDDSK